MADSSQRTKGTSSPSGKGSGPVILQVLPELGAGGAPQTAIDIASAVQDAGGTALVACNGGFREQDLREVGGTMIHQPMHTKNPYGTLANILRLVQLIDMYQVDLVHARSRAPAWSALAAARIAGKPFLTTYHGTYSGQSRLKMFYNSVMVRGDAVIANSHFIAGHIAKSHGVPLPEIDVIPRGIDMTWFDPHGVNSARVEKLRRAWNVQAMAGPQGASSRRVILMPGRLTAWKGHAVFLDALARLKAMEGQRAADWTAVIAGDDQGRDGYVRDLKQSVAERGLQKRVIFHGHCRDMPAAYLASDLVMCPSIQPEAFGRVPVEAQAMGRPVIASDHGGAAETVLVDGGDGRGQATGWRVEPGNALDLAQAMAAALGLDKAAWDAMGERGRAHVRVPYALSTMKASTLAVYDRLLTARRVAAAPFGSPAPLVSFPRVGAREEA